MLANFPIPHPDELFYSVCGRYGERTRYSNQKLLLEELFGRPTATTVVDLPNDLNMLVSGLGKNHPSTFRNFVGKHTLFPFYRPFLPQKRVRKVLKAMKHGGDIHMTIGVMASSVRAPLYLKHCPVCAERDRERYGEAYWHRLPQLPGIEICPDHLVWLERSGVRRSNRSMRHAFMTLEAVVEVPEPRFICKEADGDAVLLWIAEQAKLLLENSFPVLGIEELRHRYRWLLAERGLASYSGRIRAEALTEAFSNTYDQATLNRLQCPVNADSEHNWLLRLVRSPKGTQHPLKHLLLIRFLGLSVNVFLRSPTPLPFGKGPWPCLNRAANHFRQSVIASCEVSYTKDHGKPVGTFACDCGFAYARTGPDTEQEDKFRIDRMVAFGEVWFSHLQALWQDEGMSLRGLSRRLGVDPRTAKRQAEFTGLTDKRSKDKEPATSQEQCSRRDYRAEWLGLQAAHPKAGRTELRALLPDVYAGLYRNDKAWLERTSPKPKIAASPQMKAKWQALDEELAKGVGEVIIYMRSQEERPARITVTSVGRELGRLSIFQKHLDKLPKTAEALNRNVDTRESFAVRRVEWTLRYCHKQGISPERWQFARLAGLRPELLHTAVIEQALANALRQLP